jgi:hypothetical protein
LLVALPSTRMGGTERHTMDLARRLATRGGMAVEVAAARLATARTDAEPLVALPGGPELYADAALRLGAVMDHLGRTEDAQAMLALALALDPERPITLAEFSPDIVDAVAATRAAPGARDRVAITTSPPGAAIRVDGEDVGRAPIELQLARVRIAPRLDQGPKLVKPGSRPLALA